MFGFTICIFLLSSTLPRTTVSGEKTTALKFSGDGLSVISFSPDMSALTDKYTACLWVRKLRSGYGPIAFAYKESELFLRDSGDYRVFGTELQLSSKMAVGTWYHFCGTWSLASRTFRAYINGNLVKTDSTPSGRKLKTGGTLVLGNYWDPAIKGSGGLHFGGEMYNFNMFSKELTGNEVAELSKTGFCTQVPNNLEEYKVIKWEEILKKTRRGNVQDLKTSCEKPIPCESEKASLNSTQKELQEVKGKFQAKEGELSETVQELTDTKTELSETAQKLTETEAELDDTKQELSKTATGLDDTTQKLTETEAELDDTKKELSKTASELDDTKQELSKTATGLNDTTQKLTETEAELDDTKKELKELSENALQKGNITKWDVLYSCAYYDKILTKPSYKKLKKTLGSVAGPLVDTKITGEVIERMKDQHKDKKCG